MPAAADDAQPPATTQPSATAQRDLQAAQTAATAVRRGVVRLGRRLRLERPAHDVPLLQLAVLAELNNAPPLTPGQLAATQRVQPQSLTRVLATLETSGLIARQPDPADGRRALLAITEPGRDALRRDVSQRDTWLAQAMTTQLTPTEQELLRLAGTLMERLAET
ncbi:MAG TPA: MarR family transcriptional regulator [Streptosporangiaceae bacterium]|nr:MarR family transcriptional regulator [Streptosporangiaceae bacterium]